MAGVVELQRLLVRLTGDNTQYRQMLKQAERQTKMYTDKSGRVHDALTHKFVKNNQKMIFQLNMLGRTMMMTGEKMIGMGRTLALKLTAPLMLLGGLAARAFAKFDSAMTQSIAIMDVTASQIERMTNLARGMSASGQALQGADELARSYFYLASAGKDAEQSMQLLPVVSKFATAGMFDMALATDLLTDAQSALGLSVKDTARDMENMWRVSDVLVKANTLANATVEQFSRALTTKAGAAMKVYGKDVEEGVAVLAAFADQGVKAQLAGNALDRIMRLMSKGAIDNAKAHKALGFRVFDSTGKMRNLGDVIGNLEDVLRSMSDEQRAVALDMLGFEARVQGVLLPLIGTSKAIKEYEKQLRSAGGITKKVADEQMKSFGARIKVVWNQIKGLAIEIGKTLAPAIKALGGIFGGLAGWFTKWPAWLKAIAAAIAALLATLGPLLIVLGTMTRVIGAIGVGLTSLTAKLGISKMAILSWKAAWVGVIAVGIIIFLDQVAKSADKARREIDRLNEKRQEGYSNDEEMRRQERARLAKELAGKGGIVPRSGLEVVIEQTEKDRMIVARRLITARKRLAHVLQVRAGGGEFQPAGLFGLGESGKSVGESMQARAQANFDREKARHDQLLTELTEWEDRLKSLTKPSGLTGFGKGLGVLPNILTEMKLQSLKSLEEQFGGPGGPLARFGRMGAQGAGGLIAQLMGTTAEVYVEGKQAGRAFTDGFFGGMERQTPGLGAFAKGLTERLADPAAKIAAEVKKIDEALKFGLITGEIANLRRAEFGKQFNKPFDLAKSKGTTADFSGTQVARAGSAEMLSRIIGSKANKPQERIAEGVEHVAEILDERLPVNTGAQLHLMPLDLEEA